MSKICVKCGYARQASDTAPDYECPKCGVIYAKAEAALAAKKLVTTEPNAPAPARTPPKSSSAKTGFWETFKSDFQKGLAGQVDQTKQTTDQPKKPTVKSHGLGIGCGSLIEHFDTGKVEYRPTASLNPVFTVSLKDVTGVSGQRKSQFSSYWTMKIHGMGCILAEADVAINTVEKVAAWFQRKIDLREVDEPPTRAAPAPAPAPALALAPAPAPALAPSGVLLDHLQQLANLHRTGVLTDDEFSAAKHKLLSS